MKKLKLHLPKIRVDIARILAILLLAAAAGEIFILYRALYAEVETVPPEPPKSAANAVDIDLVQYNKIKNWIDSRRNFVLPEYSLRISTTTGSTTISTGRENPFADY